jgi:hypothetical protein
MCAAVTVGLPMVMAVVAAIERAVVVVTVAAAVVMLHCCAGRHARPAASPRGVGQKTRSCLNGPFNVCAGHSPQPAVGLAGQLCCSRTNSNSSCYPSFSVIGLCNCVGKPKRDCCCQCNV